MTDASSRRRMTVVVALLAAALFVVTAGVAVAATVTESAPEGPTVNVTAVSDPSNVETETLDNQTILVDTNVARAIFRSDGKTETEVSKPSIDDGDIRLSQVDTNGSELSVSPSQGTNFALEGELVRFNMLGFGLDDGSDDFEYRASDTVIFSPEGLPEDTTVGVFEKVSGDFIDSDRTSQFGEAEFNLPATGGDTQRVRVATLDNPPQISAESPSDESEIQSSQDSLSVDIAHTFALRQVDNVTVNFFLDGEKIDTQIITSNQTVSTSIAADKGGIYDWKVVAEDNIGQRSTAEYQFKAPANISIYDGINTSTQLVTGNTTHGETIPAFDVEVFGDDGTETLTVNDGVINMSNLTVADPITFRISEASDSNLSYQPRNYWIRSIYEQDEIYLLPGNVTDTASVVFELDDNTGEYQDNNATIQIQRSISKDFDGDGTNESRYQTMAGDQFDVNGQKEFTMIDGDRYRIVVSNDDGDRRVLGSYDVSGSVFETLEVGEIVYGDTIDTGAILNAQLVETDTGRVIRYRYQDGDALTTNLSVAIIDTSTNEIIHSVQTGGEIASYAETVEVPGNAPEQISYDVIVIAERDGEQIRREATIGDLQDVGTQTGVPDRVLMLLSWAGIIGMMGLTVIFDDGLAALVGWAMATALSLLGFIAIPGTALAMAGGIALIYNVARNSPVR